IWRWVQQDGDEKLRERAERVQAMFGDGEAPPRPDRPVPSRLTVAVDATGIRLIEGEGASVKLAVSFTGTERLTGSKRRLLRRPLRARPLRPSPGLRARADLRGPPDRGVHAACRRGGLDQAPRRRLVTL